MQTIEIKGKKYQVDFKMRALKSIGKLWGLNSLNKVQNKIAKGFSSISAEAGEEVELTFEQLDLLRDMFYTSIKAYNPKFTMKADELIDYLVFEDSKKLGELTQIYTNSIQKNDPVDPNVRKGQKK